MAFVVHLLNDYFFIFKLLLSSKPHRWRNDYRARLECGRSWVRAPVGKIKDYKIGIFCLPKHASLRSKRKDWLARNQNNVSD